MPMKFNAKSVCPNCGDKRFEGTITETRKRVHQDLLSHGWSCIVWSCGHYRTVNWVTWN